MKYIRERVEILLKDIKIFNKMFGLNGDIKLLTVYQIELDEIQSFCKHETTTNKLDEIICADCGKLIRKATYDEIY